MSSLTAGIIGLPNVGKSTLFNILLDKIQAQSSNFPFTTIDPNTGVVPVPDSRLTDLARIIQKETGANPPKVPAAIHITDIAGLVKGAHKGEGLGNTFLSHIRQVDVVIHVVRVFEDSTVVRVGQNPTEDILAIHTELALKDIDSLEKSLAKIKKRHDPDSQTKKQLILKLIRRLSGSATLDLAGFSDKEKPLIRDFFLLSAKPVIYLFNLSESQLSNTDLLSQLQKAANPHPALFACLKTEQELIGLSKQEKLDYLNLLNQSVSSVDKLIQLTYQKLGLISFFTAGIKEVRAWSIKIRTPAVQAAGVIHSDFQQNFIKAKIIPFPDFVKFEGWAKAKQHGKIRFEGKNYLIQDGDVVEFIVNK
ncbi:MAG: redox-regulated ATPase YchF [bacterium]|nr:redox-regulated ATPase YchF [bacterium]